MNTNQLEVEVNGNKIMITLTDDQIKQLQTPKKMEWYEEIEFELVTLKGKPAPWLNALLSEKDQERIQAEISEQINSRD